MPDTPASAMLTGTPGDGATIAAMLNPSVPKGIYLGGEVTESGGVITIGACHGFATYTDGVVYEFQTRAVTAADAFGLFPDPDPVSTIGCHVIVELVADPIDATNFTLQISYLLGTPPAYTDAQIPLGLVVVAANDADPATWDFGTDQRERYEFAGAPGLPIYTQRLAADVTESAASYIDVFPGSVALGDITPLRAGRAYRWTFLIVFTSNNTANGIDIEHLTTTGSALCAGVATFGVSNLATGGLFSDTFGAAVTSVLVAGNPYFVLLEGIVVQTSDGILNLRFAKTGGAGKSTTIKAGSAAYAIPIA